MSTAQLPYLHGGGASLSVRRVATGRGGHPSGDSDDPADSDDSESLSSSSSSSDRDSASSFTSSSLDDEDEFSDDDSVEGPTIFLDSSADGAAVEAHGCASRRRVSLLCHQDDV